MTPNMINEIFSRRGYQAARNVAATCRDAKLLALVERRKLLGRNFNLEVFLREQAERSNALARFRAEEAAKFAASVNALGAVWGATVKRAA